MVKKVTRNNAGVNSQTVGLGYVLNEELLDEILGEYDQPKRGGLKACPPPQATKVPPKVAPKKQEEVMDEEDSEEDDYYEVEKILDKR